MRNRRSILSLFIIMLLLFILVSCGPTTKRSVTPPTPDNTVYVYSGSPITYNIERSTMYSVSNTIQTNAGTYDVVISLKDKDNYAWVTTSNSDDLIYKFIIAPKGIAKPAVTTTTYSYTGSEITFDIPTSSYYTISNNKATAAGNYTATVSLKDKANYVWEDNTTADITFDFSIVNVDLSYAAVEGINNDYVYTGSEIKPTPTVKFGNDTLVLNQDYSLTYQNNVNVGQATVSINGLGNFRGTKTVNYNIVKADPTVTAPTAKTLTYNKNSQELINPATTTGGRIEYKLENGEYSTSIPEATNAGTYKVYYRVVGNNNYNDKAEGSIDVTIQKANYDLSGITFDNKAYTYDGTEKELTITGTLPRGVTVTYTNNKLTNVGEVTATAKFVGDSTNYNEIADMTATLSISKMAYDMSNVKFENKAYTYDGTEKELVISGTLPQGVTVTYTNNKLTNAGEVTATAKFVGDDNHALIADMTATLTIDKATYDMSNVKFEDLTTTYDGTEKELVITGTLPEGVTVTYTNNKLTNAGVVEAKASFTGNANYNAINDLTATLTINKANYDMSGVTFEDATYTYDGTVKELVISGTLPTGVTVAYSNNKLTNAGVVEVNAVFTGNENYNAILPMTAKLTIKKAQVTKPAEIDFDVTYDGTEKTYALEENALYTITNNVATNAGEYNAKVALKDKDNYEWDDSTSLDLTYPFEIKKATYDMSGVKFENKAYTYDGTEKELIISGTLPQGVTVSYKSNTLTNAGEIEATASFIGNINYLVIPNMTATLTIEKADSIITKAPAKIDNLVYTGEALELITAGEATDGELKYRVESTNFSSSIPTGIDATTYVVYYMLVGDQNHNDTQEISIEVEIKKATYDLSAISFDDLELTYNGKAQSITITGTLPEGVKVTYKDNELTNVGSTLATASFEGNINYNDINDMKATLTIIKANPTVTAPKAIEGLIYNGDVQELIEAGSSNGGTILYSIDGTNYTNTLPAGINAGDYTVYFKVEGNDNYNSVEAKSLTVNIAKADPIVIKAPTKYEGEMIYTGQSYTLLQGGEAQGGEIWFSIWIEKAGEYQAWCRSAIGQSYAGTWKICYKVRGDSNHNDLAPVEFEFVIAKGTYDMSGISFENKTQKYTGSEIEILISGNLPEGVTVSYANNKLTNVGSTLATASFEGDSKNYEAIANMQATLTITKENSVITTAPAAITGLTYNKNAQALISAGATSDGTLVYALEENGTYSSEIPTGTNAGKYSVWYKVEGDGNHTDTEPVQIENISIAKADPTIITAPTKYEGEMVYNGHSYTLLQGGEADGGEILFGFWSEQQNKYDVFCYGSVNQTDAGTWKVCYYIIGDNNHNDSALVEFEFTILKADATITAPTAIANLIYNKNAQELVAAGTTTGGTIKYSLDGTNYSADIPTGTNAGNYTIYYMLDGGTNYNDIAAASLNNSIAKANPTYTAPTSLNPTYDGTAKELISAGQTDGGTFLYQLNSAYSADIPTATNAGNYTVYYKIQGDDNYNDVTEKYLTAGISKAQWDFDTAPTAIDNLVYNGNAQALITEATAANGTIEYKLDNGEYSTTIPSAANAGNYVVYYKLIGDANHDGKAEASINVSIAKIQINKPSAVDFDETYDGNEKTYALEENALYTITNNKYTDAGSYTAIVAINDKVNYEWNDSTTADLEFEFAIKKATPILTAPIGKSIPYNGNAHALITAGSTTGGTLEYKLDNGEYSTTIPQAVGSETESITYKIYYRVVGGTNYEDIAEAYVTSTISISKVNPVVTAPTKVEGLIYNEQAQTLIAAGSTTGGTLHYSIDGTNYSKDLPTATNAGTYTVYYKVVGDEHYNDTTPAQITGIVIAKATATYNAPTDKNLVYTGEPQELVNRATSPHGTFTYRLQSTNHSANIPTGTNVGSYVVYYRLIPDNNHTEFELSITVSITKATYDMSGITFTGATYDYDETAKSIAIAGTLPSGVTVQYNNQSINAYSATDAGTYTVTAKFTGDYNNYYQIDNMQATLTINKIASTIDFEAATNLVYTGSAQELVAKADVVGGTVLYKHDGANYFETTPTGTDAKTYVMWYKVIGDKNHNDIAEVQFSVEIAKADSTINTTPSKIDNLVYTGSAQALITAGSASGGTIKYSLDGTNYSNNVPQATNADDYTIYYKVEGNSNHNDIASATIAVSIAKADASYSTAPTALTLTYNRYSQILINAAASSHGSIEYKLNDGAYSASLPQAENAGTYTVYYKLTGDNNHNNIAEASIDVTIAQASILNASITLAEGTHTFDGTEHKPAVTSVILGSYTLPSTAYTVSYSDNVNAGTATVTITPVDTNYTDTKDKTFTIGSKSLTGAVVTLAETSIVFTGSNINPGISSVVLDEVNITSDDYNVTYPNPARNVGNYTVTITGKRNYKDSVTASYTIVTQNVSISGVTMSFDQDTFTFNNSDQIPTITLIDSRDPDNPIELKENDDYILTFNNRSIANGTGNTKDAGTIEVTATGGGNVYTGTVTKTYTIEKKTLSNPAIELDNPTYSGSSLSPQLISVYDGGIDITSLCEITGFNSKKDANTYTVTITFNPNNNNYESGTFPTEWTINPKSASTLTIADIDDIPYTTNVHTNGATPNVEIYDGLDLLVLDKDYTVEYSNNNGNDITSTNIESEATITITFKGNYTGVRTKTFNIVNSEFTITYVDPADSNNNTSDTYHAADDTVGTLLSLTRTGYTGVWSSTKGNLQFGATDVTPDYLGGNITLTATWTPITYTITYYLSEGTNGAGNPSTYNIETPTITLADPSNTQADEFLGWYTHVLNQANDDYTGTTITEIPLGSTGDISLYAKWKYKIYFVTYNNMDGATNPNTNLTTVTPDSNFDLADATKPYYDFKGWFEDEVFTPSKQVTAIQNANADIVLYAKWELHEYTISYLFNVNSSSISHSNPDKYKLGDSINLTNAALFGHRFDGWFESDYSTAITIPTSAPTDITLYGKFTAANTTFTKYLNDSIVTNNLPGTIINNMNTKHVGELVSATASVNTGYNFDGWFVGNTQITSTDDQDAVYLTNNGLTLNFILTVNETVYKANYSSYTLSYSSANTNRGTVSATISSTNFESGNLVAKDTVVTLTASTESGYTFIGWFKDSDTTATATTLNYNYTMTKANISFEARWIMVTVISENEVTLGTVTELDSTYIVGQSVNLTATPLTGVVFLGWYSSNDYTQTALSNDNPYQITMPSVDTTYYAHFVSLASNVTIIQYDLHEALDENDAYIRGYTQTDLETPTYVISGQTVTYTMPTNNTYAFAGWWKIPDASDKDERTKINDTISLSCSILINDTPQTIYALWVSYSIQVEKSHNDNELSYTETCELITDGITLESSGDVVDNYNWLGWYNSNNQELTSNLAYVVPYSYYQKLVEVTSTYAQLSIPTYNAVWNQYGITVEVKPNANSQTGGGTVNKSYDTTTSKWTISATADNGFVFSEWLRNGLHFSDTATTTNIAGASGTYTAAFELATVNYTVNYHFEHYADDDYDIGMHKTFNNGLVNGYVDIDKTATSGFTVNTSVIENTNIPEYYEFYQAKANGNIITPNSGTAYRFTISIGDGTDSLDFYYTLKRITVTYHYNDGTLSNAEEIKNDKTNTPYKLKDSGENVTWYTNSNLTGSPVTSLSADGTVWACYDGNNNLTSKFTILDDYYKENTTNIYYKKVIYIGTIANANIVIPNYIDDLPVKKVNVDNLYNITDTYTSLTMPSELAYLEYGKDNNNDPIGWIIIEKPNQPNNQKYKLLCETYLGTSVYDSDYILSSYETSEIKGIVDSFIGNNGLFTLKNNDSISLLTITDYNSYSNLIKSKVYVNNWWLYDLYVDEEYNEIVGSYYIDDNDIIPAPWDDTKKIRPTLTLTIPASNTVNP